MRIAYDYFECLFETIFEQYKMNQLLFILICQGI